MTSKTAPDGMTQQREPETEERDVYAEIQADADKHHRHTWQPGPMIAGWSSHAPGDEGTPNELVVLCPCGAVGRVEVPRHQVLPTPTIGGRLRSVR